MHPPPSPPRHAAEVVCHDEEKGRDLTSGGAHGCRCPAYCPHRPHRSAWRFASLLPLVLGALALVLLASSPLPTLHGLASTEAIKVPLTSSAAFLVTTFSRVAATLPLEGQDDDGASASQPPPPAPLAPASRQAPGPVTVSSAFGAMLDNIGGFTPTSSSPSSYSQVEGAVADGTVIASPSKASPDYFYSWVRDSALVGKVLVTAFERREFNVTRKLVQRYLSAQAVQQRNALSSPSGSSLGEPKFHADNALFTRAWGRPQNDGAALRATVAMRFARAIGLSDPYVGEALYRRSPSTPSLVKSDLEYVAHHWRDACFDVWEELWGHHLFTLAVQRRALAEGAEFADELGDAGAARYYREQAWAISERIESFWSASEKRWNAYLLDYPDGASMPGGRDGVDSATLLAAVHAWNQTSDDEGVSDASLGPASPRVLSTLRQYVEAFRPLYPINAEAEAPRAVATGRYVSDVYDGVGTSRGNPWFLTTLNVAELLYDAVRVLRSRGAVDVTSVDVDFYRQFQRTTGVVVGVGERYGAGSEAYGALLGAMRAQADGMVDVVQRHADQVTGSLSEQMHRDTGYLTGARDLTWSYAAFITASWARAGTPSF